MLEETHMEWICIFNGGVIKQNRQPIFIMSDSDNHSLSFDTIIFGYQLSLSYQATQLGLI